MSTIAEGFKNNGLISNEEFKKHEDKVKKQMSGNRKFIIRAKCDGCDNTTEVRQWQKTHYRLCLGCAVLWSSSPPPSTKV